MMNTNIVPTGIFNITRPVIKKITHNFLYKINGLTVYNSEHPGNIDDGNTPIPAGSY